MSSTTIWKIHMIIQQNGLRLLPMRYRQTERLHTGIEDQGHDI